MLDAPTRVVVVHFPRWSQHAASLGCSARSAFDTVVQAIVAHAPLVEVAAPGTVVFATRGPSRYVGGDARLAALVHATVSNTTPATFGLGIADGRLAAGIAACRAVQAGEPVVVPVDESARWLATAPVRALIDCVEMIGAVGAGVPDVDDVASYRDVVSLLERLGLYRFADVAALSESDLIARFGAFGRDLSRLSRGLDRYPPLVVEPPPERIRLVRFDAPVESRDTVVSAAGELSAGLVDHLRVLGLAMVRLHILLESDHGERNERMWYRSEGFTPRAIIESLRWQLDAWILHDAPTSGVVAVRLSPEQFVVDAGRQSTLWGGERDGDRHAQRAVRRVADMNGADSVTVPAWRGDRDPARSFEFVRSDAVDFERHVVADRSVDQWRGALPSPAPSLVFDASSEAGKMLVLDVHDRPLVVDARHAMSGAPTSVAIDGRRYDVVAWAGPWPVEERWWDPRRARRAVRLQLVVRPTGTGASSAALVAVLERRTWRLAAWYA
jgi:protein ImuB